MRSPISQVTAVVVGMGLLGMFGLGVPWAVGAEPADECVACHTDPAKLQALAQEPPLSEEEGEG